MGIGVVALQTSQKKEQSGAPFVPGSAYNGTSIDPAGKVVLGNDVGEVGSPAQLISNREIITEDALFNLFGVILNSAVTGVTTTLDGQEILMAGANNTSPLIDMTSSGAVSVQRINMTNSNGGDNIVTLLTSGNGLSHIVCQSAATGSSRLTLRCGATDAVNIQADGLGSIRIGISNLDVAVIRINTLTFNTQIGGIVAFNGATLQVSGSCTYRRVLQNQTGVYDVDRDLDSSKLFTNNGGAIQFNLPNMAAANNRPGFIFRACAKNIIGLTIQTFAGQQIFFGDLSSTVGGTVFSVDTGSYIVLVWDSSTSTWLTECFTGIWTLT